jgi:hypothetical protein
VVLNITALVCALALVQEPSPLSLFVYSRDSIHGFKDELLDVFRRELGKHVESIAEVAYSREEAQVSVQFLGQGELELELGEAEAPARHVFRLDETAPRTWALVRVGNFAKEFSVEGTGARDLGRLSKSIADWMRANASAIRSR